MNDFLSSYLLLSQANTWIFVAILIGTFVFNRYLAKKEVGFTVRMVISIGLGLALGLVMQLVAGFPASPMDIQWVKEVSSWYGLFGNGFMDLLKMIVVPIVFFAIIRVIMNMTGKDLKKITIRTILMLLGTTVIAAAIGILVGSLFHIGMGSQDLGVATGEIREVTTIVQTLRDLLPQNIVAAMANGNVVGVIIFASFIGFAIRKVSQYTNTKVEAVTDFVEGFYNIITEVAMSIIMLTPYAVVPLLANTILGRGLESIVVVVQFIGALYLAMFLMFIVHLIILMINGVSPKTYLKQGFAPLALAFSSRSSLGTLPVTIETLTDNLGVKNGIASFAGSLGANMGMNGCAGVYPALVAVTIANMVGIPIDFNFIVMLVIVIAISSLGIAGIPGTATIALALTLSGMGLGEYFPLIGGIIAIDPILDMGRTMLNVSGAMTTAITVNKSLEK